MQNKTFCLHFNLFNHGLTAPRVQNSHPDSREIINRGDMLPDTVVGDLLLEALLIKSCAAPECGVLVDGFPRTSLQVGHNPQTLGRDFKA